jgi:hypothetical protein
VRLHVAVQHPGPVGGVERVQHGEADPGRRRRGIRTVLIDDLVQGTGRHVLHHDPREVVGMHDVVDADHVRMVQAGGAAGLPQRTVAQPGPFGVRHPVRRDELLHGDVAVEHLVAGHPDPAHTTGADRLVQTIPAGDKEPPDRHQPPPIALPPG